MFFPHMSINNYNPHMQTSSYLESAFQLIQQVSRALSALETGNTGILTHRN